MGHYESEGCIFAPGEAPTCHCCGQTPDETTLYETAYSGVFCCTDGTCAVELVMMGGEVLWHEDEEEDETDDA